jgi:ATP-dependent DNA ligase
VARTVRGGPRRVEGVVAKGLAQPYRSGARDWPKCRYRDTVEVVVGAVTGTLEHPERLILGLDRDDQLMMVGGTSALSTAQQQMLAPLLVTAGHGHPWPPVIGGGHVGYRGGKDIDIIRVEPDTVVEVAADTSTLRARNAARAALAEQMPPALVAEIVGMSNSAAEGWAKAGGAARGTYVGFIR